MARQLAERFGVNRYFSDARQLLESTQPDVIHITTPPQSHLELGNLCLEAGAHVFFEKPFTLSAVEAEKIVALANNKKRKITVGHNNQFNHATRRMRELIQKGFLGGPPMHMESVWSYDLGDMTFAKALLSDRTHWVRRLPGRLLHNIISHGIAKIAEFLAIDDPQVIAHGHSSPLLKHIHETDIIDELRVIIYDQANMTAYFTFSSQIFPRQQLFRIFGPQNTLIVDDMHQTLIQVCQTNYKSYLNYFIPPRLYAKQYKANSRHNITDFLKRDFNFEEGRRILIESFYRAIQEGGPLPLSYREILLTAKIMDSIFAQIYSQ
jgi:predicted dehydrogenase